MKPMTSCLLAVVALLRGWWPGVRLALAVAALGCAALGQSYLGRHEGLTTGLALHGAGALLFVAACVGQAWRLPAPVHYRAPAAGVAALSFLAAAVVLNVVALLFFVRDEHLNAAWLMFSASLVVLVGGLAWVEGQATLSTHEAPSVNSLGRRVARFVAAHWLEGLLLGGVIGLAVGLRLYRIDSFPGGLWYDEAVYGNLVDRMLDDASYRPVYAPPANMSGPFLFLIAGAFKVFGRGMLAIRLVSAGVGIATVVAFYFLARIYLSRPVALAATVLLAVSAWHLNFSRIGLQGILSPLFGVLALLFLVRAWRSGRLTDFALAGFAVSGGVWAYSASNVLPAVAAVFVVAAALAWRSRLRERLPGLALLAVAFAVSISPLAYYAATHQDEYFARARETNIFRDRTAKEELEVLVSNTRKHVLMFNYKGDNNGRHNLPGHPMLDDATGVLAVLGLAYAVYRIRRPEYLLLLVALLLGLTGGIFTLDFEAPQSLRSILTLPVAYLLAGVALEAVWRSFTPPGRAALARGVLAAGLLVGLLAYAGVLNYDTFFNKKAKDFASWAEYSTDVTLVANEIQGRAEELDIWLSPFYVGQPTLRFLAPDLKEQRPFDIGGAIPVISEGEKDAALFVDVGNEHLVGLARIYYEGAEIKELGPDFQDTTVAYAVYIPAEEIKALRGLEGRYYDEPTSSEPSLTRNDEKLDFDWREAPPLSPPFTVRWTGFFYAPDFGEYSLVPEGSFERLELTIDSERLPSGGSLTLAKGLHEIEIDVDFGHGSLFRLLWREPGRDLEVIPPRFLFRPKAAPHGLFGRFFSGPTWSGPPALERIDPQLSYYFHITPLPRPYTVEWRGTLLAPDTGEYRFILESVGPAALHIDGAEVLNSPGDGSSADVTISLARGEHDLVVRYLDDRGYSRISLAWVPPGGEHSIVPFKNLLPRPAAHGPEADEG